MINFSIKYAIAASASWCRKHFKNEWIHIPLSSIVFCHTSSFSCFISDRRCSSKDPRGVVSGTHTPRRSSFSTRSACDFRYHDFRMVDHLRTSAGRSLNRRELNDIKTPSKIHERSTKKSHAQMIHEPYVENHPPMFLFCERF